MFDKAFAGKGQGVIINCQTVLRAFGGTWHMQIERAAVRSIDDEI